MPPPTPPRFDRAVVLLFDGARPDVLRRLAAAGELPHIARLFVDGKTAVDAVSVFPSTTGPAHLPFLTGRFPGPCNMPGIRWFDRAEYARTPFSLFRFRSYMGPVGSFLIGWDLRRDVRTLFEDVRDHALIGGTMAKGCRFTRNRTRIGRELAAAMAFLTEDWFHIDRLAWRALVNEVERGTQFTFAAFYSIDGRTHKRGCESDEALQAYRRLDGVIGDLAAALEKRGELERTFIALVSDHGASDTHTHFDLAGRVEQVVGGTLHHPMILRRLVGARSSVMVSGNSMAHVYLRNGDGWGRPHPIDDAAGDAARLARHLLDEEAVDILCGRAQRGGLRVLSRRGAAHLALDGDRVSYAVDGADPFGLPPLPRTMTRREALRHTIDSDYPDALVQLGQLFMSPRTGDVVVSATCGFDLRDGYERPPHVGSHGSLRREHMLIPLFVNHRLGEGPFRATDVYPTILAGLGLDVPGDLDGTALPLLATA